MTSPQTENAVVAEDPRMAQVREYLRDYLHHRRCEAYKVSAVKLYREIHGCGLVEALNVCNAIVGDTRAAQPKKDMRTLEGRFIYYTETQLATLEMLKSRKSSSQSDIRRQNHICAEMMEIVKGIAAEVDIVNCPRVSSWLAASIK